MNLIHLSLGKNKIIYLFSDIFFEYKFYQNTNNNLASTNQNNPVKIKKLYDNIKNNKKIEIRKISGYLTSRKK